MKLKVIPPPAKSLYKANIHTTGRIGLALDTAEKFGFTIEKTVDLCINENRDDRSIYIIFNEGDNGYKIQKTGKYHAILAKSFFESIDVEIVTSRSGGIPCTIQEIDHEGKKILKLVWQN